jgi:hypothetical protein
MTKPDLSVNYRDRTTMPIHDMVTSTIVCLVDIYGWTKGDVAVVAAFSRLRWTCSWILRSVSRATRCDWISLFV